MKPLGEHPAQQLPEAAVEAAARALHRASGFPVHAFDQDGTPRGLLCSNARHAVEGFLSALTPSDLLALAVERMGDEERVVVLTTYEIDALQAKMGPYPPPLPTNEDPERGSWTGAPHLKHHYNAARSKLLAALLPGGEE